MKKIVFAFGLVMVTGVLTAQTNQFNIIGDISNLKAPIEWVFLSYTVNHQHITDSFQVKQDSYSFKGNIEEATQAELRIRYKAARVNPTPIPFNMKRDYAIVFLEPGNIVIASLDSFSNVAVTGSKADAEYRKLQAISRPFDNALADLYRRSAVASRFRDDSAKRILERQIDSINQTANEKIYGEYARKNPTSPIALYAIRNWAGYEIDAPKVEPVFMALPQAVRNSTSGKEMEQRIAVAKKTSIGQTALDFTQNDTLGNPVALSSFRGKYVLLDFWASWCGPCRIENPKLVEAYNKYRAKGFRILSVSLDRPGAKEKWLNAIHEDGLKWAHVSDLKYWDNAVAQQYGIEAIPQNLLLDPTGKIIGKNLKGEALGQKLATIYNN